MITTHSIRCLDCVLAARHPSFAQQRPLKTEDPETIGSGRMLVEAGIDYQRDVYLPVSGLRGNLFTMPAFGVSLGVSSIAEIQIDWGLYQKLSITDQVAGRAAVGPAAPRWRHHRRFRRHPHRRQGQARV